MPKLFDIPTKKLFAAAFVLKVSLSFLGWYTGSLWLLGTGIPLLVLVAYFLIGVYRTDRSVTDEKLADSCYYLGFLFTLASIICSLFDLAHIDDKMQDMAVRFGAAMLSTLLGIGARVYLVGFKSDVKDAMRTAEDSLLNAAHRLQTQLSLVVDRLQDFEGKVNEATQTTVARVSVSVEELTQNYGTQLTTFFTALAQENEQAFKAALAEVSAASLRLSESVDAYSTSMKGNLTSIEKKVTHFADAVTRRLEQTTFPDDYFARQLEEPLHRLGQSSRAMATEIATASQEVQQSVGTLRARAGQVEGALDRVVELASSQETLLAGSQAQVEALGVLTGTLRSTQSGLDALQGTLKAQVAEQHQHTTTSTQQQEALSHTVSTLQALTQTLQQAGERLQQQQQSLATVADQSATHNDQLGQLAPGLRTLTRELQKLTTSMDQHLASVVDVKQRLVQVETRPELTPEQVEGLKRSMARGYRPLFPLAGPLQVAPPPAPASVEVNGHAPHPPRSFMDDFGDERPRDNRP